MSVEATTARSVKVQTNLTPKKSLNTAITPDVITAIFNKCHGNSESKVDSRSLEVFRSDNFNIAILEQLKGLNFPNTLEDIFYFPEAATPFEMVQHIAKTIQENTKKTISNLVENYKDFYYTNILSFWQRLPKGTEFLESAEIKDLSNEEKVARFQTWLANTENTAKITTLDLYQANLAFLPKEINQLRNLKSLSLNNNQIQVIPELNLPNLEKLNASNNQIQIFSENSNLPNLLVMSLTNNPIKILPDFGLYDVQMFLFNNAKFIEIPLDIFLLKF